MNLNLILQFVVVLVIALCSYSTSKKRGRHSFLKVNRHHHSQRGKVSRHHKALHSHSVETPKSKHPMHAKPNHVTHASKQRDQAAHETLETSGEMFSHSGASSPNEQTSVVLDVGQVTVVSVSQSCNGVVLDPSLVLTSASCVFPKHGAKAYQHIYFDLNGGTKEVQQVYGNPEWMRTGERELDFALLLLAHPITNRRGGDFTSPTWSPYALEDIGESFVAMPSISKCNSASEKARGTDTIRKVNNKIITLTCDNAGMVSPGSPLFRIVDGHIFIYGLFFGQCTSGSLDRKMTGLCGSRITKQVFQDMCALAKYENIDLPYCSSKLLNSLNGDSPTEVSSNTTYDAISSTAENPKAAVFVYHTPASEDYQAIIEDIDRIQRNKVVYDKFVLAVVDTSRLPFDTEYSPFIEFRIDGSNTYLPYSDKYNFKNFKRFMVDFGRVGVPQLGSTSFLHHLKVVSTRSTTSSPRLKRPHSSNIKGSTSKFLRLSCDTERGMELTNEQHRCICKTGYIGSGAEGKCQDRDEAIKSNCRYDVEEKTSTSGTTEQTYDQIQKLTGQTTWCNRQMFVFSYLLEEVETVDVSGEDLTPDDCDEAIEEMVTCPKEDKLLADRFSKYHNSKNVSGHHHNHSSKSYKQTVTLATGKAPPNYLSNFLQNKPPGGKQNTYSRNNYFILQDWMTGAEKSSTLLNGHTGTPEYIANKLNNAQMTLLRDGPTKNRRALTNSWHFDTDLPPAALQRKIQLYADRGNKKYADAVDKRHLNLSHINSFDLNTIKLTHTYTNAYPQYNYFNIGVWKKYENKIFNYAKGRCQGKSTDSELHLLTGLSDYEITGFGKGFRKKPKFWPLANARASVQPSGSKALPASAKSIVKARSLWTVGCCTWTTGSTNNAESLTVWANNEPKHGSNMEHQPHLAVLAKNIFASKRAFNFFPGNPACTIAANRYTLP